MSGAGTENFLRWALLCVLAWGVLAMHHGLGPYETNHQSAGHAVAAMPLSPPAAESPAASPNHEQGPLSTGIGNLLHLCIAVLITAVGWALVFRPLYSWRDRVPKLSRASACLAPTEPPPPSWGREILRTVCVLRL